MVMINIDVLQRPYSPNVVYHHFTNMCPETICLGKICLVYRSLSNQKPQYPLYQEEAKNIFYTVYQCYTVVVKTEEKIQLLVSIGSGP